MQKFKLDLTSLVVTLTSCERHYIRCITPNQRKEPLSFEDTKVMHQLRCTGIMETIKVRKAGFPIRMTWEMFFNSYYLLLSSANPDEVKQLFQSYPDIPPESYCFGLSKIFLKEPTLEYFNLLRAEKLEASVTIVQGLVRRRNAFVLHEVYLEELRQKRATTLQCYFRRMQSELVLRQLIIEFEIKRNKCATLLQSYVRRCITVYEYQIMLEQSRATIMQRYVRKLNAMVEFEILRDIRRARQIQARVRNYNARVALLNLEEERKGTILVQCCIRRVNAIAVLNTFRAEYEAVRAMQAAVRQYNSRCLLRQYEIEDEMRRAAAAVVLQSWIRRQVAIDRYEVALNVHHVTIIQSLMRMANAQEELNYLADERELLAYNRTVTIQSYIRRSNELVTLHELELEFARKEKERLEAIELQERELNAAHSLQNFLRRFLAQDILATLHREMEVRTAIEEQMRQQHLTEMKLEEERRLEEERLAEIRRLEESRREEESRLEQEREALRVEHERQLEEQRQEELRLEELRLAELQRAEASELDSYPMTLDGLDDNPARDMQPAYSDETPCDQTHPPQSQFDCPVASVPPTFTNSSFPEPVLMEARVPVSSDHVQMELPTFFNAPLFSFSLSKRDETEVLDFFAHLELPTLGAFLVEQAVSLKAMLMWKDPAKKLKELGVTQAGVLWKAEEALKTERQRRGYEKPKKLYYPSIYNSSQQSVNTRPPSELGVLINNQAETLLSIYRNEALGFSEATQISNSVSLENGGKLVITFKVEPKDGPV